MNSIRSLIAVLLLTCAVTAQAQRVDTLPEITGLSGEEAQFLIYSPAEGSIVRLQDTNLFTSTSLTTPIVHEVATSPGIGLTVKTSTETPLIVLGDSFGGGAIFFGNANPANADYALTGNSSATILGAPGGGGFIGFYINNNAKWKLDTSALYPSANAGADLGGSSNYVANAYVSAVKVDATNTAGGTTGAQTINKTVGTVNFAAAETTLVVTNSYVSTSSIVFAVVRTNDSTATIKNVIPGSGSFTIRLTAAATAETSVGFMVVN